MDNSAVRRLETDKDIEQYLESLRRIFGENSGVDRLAKKLMDFHSPMTLKDFFVVKHDGRIVSTLNLIPMKWSIGGTVLKVAEMGHVATLPEYRGKGLIRRLVQEFHKEVRDQEYDLSVIEGIPYFYRQFGYEYAIPLLEETRVQLDQIPKCKTTAKVRVFEEEDIPNAMDALAQSQRKFYVHSIRDKNVWRVQTRTCVASDPEPFQGYVVEEKGKMIAYFRMRENAENRELIVTEVSEVDQVTSQAILDFLKSYGMERDLITLRAAVSYEEPFAEHLVALGASKRFPPYAWQIRITDYLSIFKKLKSLFERRLASSMYARLTETLDFNFRRFSIRMTVRIGRIVSIRKIGAPERGPIGLTPPAFVQLLLGYRDRQELEALFPDFRIDVYYRHLIDVLFPKFHSYIHSAY